MREDTAKHYESVIKGMRSKVAGQFFEDMIDRTCRYYSSKGIAEIEKTPEPMKPIKSLKNGQFIAVFTKMAQPDYKGTEAGGRTIVFEAKHTDDDRMFEKVISREQRDRLDAHMELGADCFVLVSFQFERYFKIPWVVFRDMKAYFKRKYIVPEDVEEYKIEYIGGYLHFLGEEGKESETNRC